MVNIQLKLNKTWKEEQLSNLLQELFWLPNCTSKSGLFPFIICKDMFYKSVYFHTYIFIIHLF